MGRRPERLAEEMREEIARMIAFELKDPRLGFVTVTRVEIAHDLRYARVHVGVLGSEEEREKSLTALRSAAGFVRRELGRRLRIHHSPEVDFRYDKGLDATDRVARLLAQEAERDAAASPPKEPQADVGSEGGEAGSGRDRDERTSPTASDRTGPATPDRTGPAAPEAGGGGREE